MHPLNVMVIYEVGSRFAESRIMNGMRMALEHIGHKVQAFDRGKLFGMVNRFGSEFFRGLRNYIHDEQIDFVLGCGINGTLAARRDGKLFSFFDTIGVPTISYWADSFISYLERPLESGPHSRIARLLLESELHSLFLFDRQEVEHLRSLKKQVYHLPLAANTLLNGSTRLTSGDVERFRCDVAFCGTVTPPRARILENLTRFDLKIFGTIHPSCGVTGETLAPHFKGALHSAEEVHKCYSLARICLNHTQQGNVNARVFEAMAAGALVVSDKNSVLSEMFREGEEIVFYDDEEEIPEIIEYYLRHNRERCSIAQGGRARVLREHSYVNRAITLINTWRSGRGGAN